MKQIPPRPQPSEPFMKSSFPRISTGWIIVLVFCGTGLFGGLFFGAVFSELDNHDKFVKQSEIVKICTDGTRIYKLANGDYCSWLCRVRFRSPDICN